MKFLSSPLLLFLLITFTVLTFCAEQYNSNFEPGQEITIENNTNYEAKIYIRASDISLDPYIVIGSQDSAKIDLYGIPNNYQLKDLGVYPMVNDLVVGGMRVLFDQENNPIFKFKNDLKIGGRYILSYCDKDNQIVLDVYD